MMHSASQAGWRQGLGQLDVETWPWKGGRADSLRINRRREAGH